MEKSINNLQIGDTIELFKGKYGCGTVIKKGENFVSVMRPYVHMLHTPVCDENQKYIKEQFFIYGDPPQGIATIGTETVILYENSGTWLVLK